MRILLVEDDLMIGEVVSATLKEAAYAVDWLRSGEQALACVETQIYDLMLLDLGLPGVDGMDVLARIRVRQIRCRCLF